MLITNNFNWKSFFSIIKKAMEDCEENPHGIVYHKNAVRDILSENEYRQFMNILFRIRSISNAKQVENLPKDTLLAVKDNKNKDWVIRKFSHVKNNRIYCFAGGVDSTTKFQTPLTVEWDNAMILDNEVLENSLLHYKG